MRWSAYCCLAALLWLTLICDEQLWTDGRGMRNQILVGCGISGWVHLILSDMAVIVFFNTLPWPVGFLHEYLFFHILRSLKMIKRRIGFFFFFNHHQICVYVFITHLFTSMCVYSDTVSFSFASFFHVWAYFWPPLKATWLIFNSDQNSAPSGVIDNAVCRTSEERSCPNQLLPVICQRVTWISVSYH